MSSAPSPPRRRADAQRSVDRILAAAVDCLRRDPNASAGAIATAAGVSRMTLYAHFDSRDQVVEAALAAVLADGDIALSDVDLVGAPPDAALRDLIYASWQQLARTGALIQAAQATLPAEQISEMHAVHRRRVEALVQRGRDEQVFRTDHPLEWMVSLLEHVLHGAANDVVDGQLNPELAPGLISDAVVAAYRPPK